ncbi:MAG: hypothetical protein R2816_00635 [Flavobacteriaceae bacterium]|nr:hypothetical protein [Flavobacteriaceae bacterium]
MYLKFHAILITFFLSTACCFPQQAKTFVVNELAKTVFTIPEGKITVYTPNFVANEKISGGIIIEPNGNSEKSIAKNKSKLQNHKVDFGGLSTTLQTSHYSLSKSQPFPLELKLFDEKNNLIASSKIQFPIKEKNSDFFVPSYIIEGESAKIVVGNDGDLTNKYVSVNNKEAKILAASETTVFFKTPSYQSGKVPFNYKNESINLDKQVNVLQLNLSAGKLNLSRGETTKLNIEVSGLKGLEEEVPLTITNNSPSNISLEGGNNQEISIQPDGDTYQIHQTIRATQGGSFSISVTIEPPSEDNSSEENDEPLCNCIIDGYSYLINPNACTELGGQCQSDAPETFGTNHREKLGDAVGNYNFSVFNFQARILNLLSYSDDIDDIEDDITGHWDKWDRAKHIKDSLDGLNGELVAIDKVLDKVPTTYKEKFKKAIDSLENLKKQLPNPTNNKALQKAVDDAQARAEACKKRLEALQKQKGELEEQLKKDKETLLKAWKAYADIFEKHGMETSSHFDDEGKFWDHVKLNDMTDYERKKFDEDSDILSELSQEYYKALKAYRNTLKKSKNLPDQIEAAQKDCDDLANALEEAKQAKDTADLVKAIELEAYEFCKQIRRILDRLWIWCKNNPDHCDFMDDIISFWQSCPKNTSGLEDFWKRFDALVAKKKGLEDNLGKKAKEAQDDMDKIEDDIADLENEIASLEEKARKKHQDDLERKQKAAQAEAAEAAKAKAEADKRKKQRAKQKKKDKEVEDLIKKAKSDDAGTDALKNVLKGMGLSLLDEATGAGKVGTLIGGILVVKDMPDCACKMFEMLEQAIAAQLRGEDLFRDVFTNEYLRQWNNCANLPVFSSIMIGSKELSEAIGEMTKAQCREAIAALNQAQRIQCK